MKLSCPHPCWMKLSTRKKPAQDDAPQAPTVAATGTDDE
jgi:hypothetical protein